MKKIALFLSIALIFGTSACDKQQANTQNTAISTPQSDIRQPESVVYTMKNYNRVYSFENGLAQVEKDGKYGLIDKTGKEIVPPQYSMFAIVGELVKVHNENHQVGFLDKTGKVVLPVAYHESEMVGSELSVDGETLWLLNKDGKTMLFDKTGKQITPAYETIWNFSDGMAVVANNDKWGFIDKTGQVVIDLQYDDVSEFRNGLALVRKDSQYSLIDKTGTTISSLPVLPDGTTYAHTMYFGGDMIAIQKDDKYGFIDKTGKQIAIPQYDDTFRFIDGFAFVRKDNKVGFIDKTGREVVPCQYDFLPEEYYGELYTPPKFNNGVVVLAKNGKKGLVDKTGKEVVPFEYNEIYQFHDGLAQITQDGKSGFIDKTGKFVVPLQYDDVGYEDGFRKGLAEVKKDGKWGVIDTQGKEIIPPQYDELYLPDEEKEEFIQVAKDGKHGVLDKNGKQIVPVQYNHAWSFDEDLAAVEKDGKWGFVDKTGNAVIPIQYDEISRFSEGLAPVKKDGKWQFIDKTGKVVIQSEVAEVSDKAETTTNSATPAEVPESISQRFPNIDPAQYATSKYTGKIAEDIADKESSTRTRERKHLQYIRENPDEIGFAGHYTVMVFGVGGGAIQITVLDVITGKEVDSMVVSSVWKNRYPDNPENDEQASFDPNYEYSVESRLFFVQGSVWVGDKEDDGSFVFELTDNGFKLLAHSPVMKASD